jgi:exonuclease SbcC
MSDLQGQLEKLSTVEGICPICGTSLSEERKKGIIAKKWQEIEALKGNIENARKGRLATEGTIRQLESAAKKLDEMLREISDLDDIKSELEKSRQALAHYTESVNTLSAQLKSLKRGMESMKKELDDATNAKQRLEIINRQLKDYDHHKQRIEQLGRQRDQLKKEIAKFESTLGEGRMEEAERLLRTLIADEKGAEMRLANLYDLISERNARLAEYERIVDSVKKEKEDIEKLDALAKDIKIFTEALKQTQAELRKEFVEAVNYTMNKLWQTLYPYQDFIGVQMAIDEGDYVLQLQERTTNWVNVEGAASGGERSIACLALRIAFALVLAPHLRMLVLDEPTANLDTNSVKVLASTLREGISEFIDQCFIITHDDAFEEAVTGMAYRLERDKGKDGTTKIIQIN